MPGRLPQLGVDGGEDVLGLAGARTSAGCRPGRPAAASGSGRTGRTVNRRIARTRETVAEIDLIVPIRPRDPSVASARRRDRSRAPDRRLACAVGDSEGWRAWSDASPSWTSCPSSTSAAARRRPTVGEPFPVAATVFREGHDQLGAEVVLVGARRARAGRRCAMTPDGDEPDRYGALRSRPTPRAPGPSRSQAWSDPVATWQHDAGHQDPGRRRRRADVHRGRAAARAGRRRAAER